MKKTRKTEMMNEAELGMRGVSPYVIAVRRKRLELELSVADFEKLLELPAKHWQMIERGERALSPETKQAVDNWMRVYKTPKGSTASSKPKQTARAVYRVPRTILGRSKELI